MCHFLFFSRFSCMSHLSRELNGQKFGSLLVRNTSHFVAIEIPFTFTTPHSNKREFKDAKHIVLVVKLIANSSSRKYKFACILSPSHALCVSANPCDHKFRLVPIMFGVILNLSSFVARVSSLLRVSIPSLLTGSLMYPTGSHTLGLLRTKSRGRKFDGFFFVLPLPIVPQITENEKKKSCQTSQNQEIFKTQIHV